MLSTNGSRLAGRVDEEYRELSINSSFRLPNLRTALKAEVADVKVIIGPLPPNEASLVVTFHSDTILELADRTLLTP